MAIWKIAPGGRAWVWESCLKRGCISVNWLNNLNYTDFDDRREIKRVLIHDDPDEGTGGAPSIWRFTYKVNRGDVVVANDGLSRVVGIGRITSGYLEPNHPKNPNTKQDNHRHVRLVDWVVDQDVDLGKQLFIRPTVQPLSAAEVRYIVEAYSGYPKLKGKLNQLFEDQPNGEDFGPADDEAELVESGYHPPEGDLRESAWELIKKRRGQAPFRNSLLRRYGSRCLVTGCQVVAVLEAAHIDSYRADAHHHSGNGLILRSDIYTLFDLNLLGVEPDSLGVELHPDLIASFGGMVRKKLRCTQKRRPLRDALDRRYKEFKKRIRRAL